MTTTQKHESFLAEPMGEKRVQALPGIGETLGRRLEDQGFDKAYKVQAQYLMVGKDEGRFKEWLKNICQANSKQQNDCYRCIKEWTDNFH